MTRRWWTGALGAGGIGILFGLHKAHARAERVAEPAAVDSIASPAAAGSGEPNLAVSPDGRVYMSWLEPVTDSGHALRFAVHDGSRWSASRTIRAGRDFFVNWADFPSIEVLSEDHLVAHWLQRSGSGSYAYGVRIAQSRDGGRTWSTPVIPHRDSARAEHGFVSLWAERGGVGAVWLDGRKFSKDPHGSQNEMMLVSTAIGADGARTSEARLDERTCDCCQTTAAITSKGPIVAYRDRSAAEIRDIHVIRRVSGQWTAPAPVHNDGWHIAACPVNGPAMVARGNRVALAWFTAARDTARVNVAFSSNSGASFGVPVRVDDGLPGGRVDAQLLADGSALVSWIERTGGDAAAVRVRRVSNTGRLGRALTIATSSAARASGFPRMIVAGNWVMLAWTEPGKPSQVRVARVALSSFK